MPLSGTHLWSGRAERGRSRIPGAADHARSKQQITCIPRSVAHADPAGFVEPSGRMQIIDKVQRAPELLLAIKAVVDADPTPGKFLLTGSARVLAMRGVADSLPGRTESIELWPLSQGENDGTRDDFADAVFEQGPGLHHESDLTRADYFVDSGIAANLLAQDSASLRRPDAPLGGLLEGFVQWRSPASCPGHTTAQKCSTTAPVTTSK